MRDLGYIICKECGKSVKRTGGTQKTCKPCRAIINRELRDKYRRSPEGKEYQKEHKKTQKAKDAALEYSLRPEVKKRKADYSRNYYAQKRAFEALKACSALCEK